MEMSTGEISEAENTGERKYGFKKKKKKKAVMFGIGVWEQHTA